MSDYYVYKLGGWWIACDAINHQDAAQFIKAIAPGAKYIGKGVNMAPKTATGAITDARQAEIREHNRRWLEGVSA